MFCLPENAMFCLPENPMFCLPVNPKICSSENTMFCLPDNSMFCLPENPMICLPDNSMFCLPDNSMFCLPENPVDVRQLIEHDGLVETGDVLPHELRDHEDEREVHSDDAEPRGPHVATAKVWVNVKRRVTWKCFYLFVIVVMVVFRLRQTNQYVLKFF
jgi:hypothetical protein